MGANATTFVPSYTSGEVLTAANLSVTNSGIPVFANSTARTAAFGGTGEKILAEGQFSYLEDTNTTQYYDGAAWQPVGASGLVRVGGGTLSGSTTAFTNVFSSTYQAYKIIVTGGVLTNVGYVTLIFGSTATGYKNANLASNFSTGAYSAGFAQGTTFFAVTYSQGTDFGSDITVVNPQLAKNTFTSSSLGFVDATIGGLHAGVLQDSTQYTGFTLGTTAGTFSAGTVNIYGYALS